MKPPKKPPKGRLDFTEEENAILQEYIDKYGEDPTLDYAISLGESAALELIKKAIHISSAQKILLQLQNIITVTFMQWWFTI